MSKKFDQSTPDAVFSAPLEIVARLRAPWGALSAFPTRDDIEDFLKDPEARHAPSQGVTLDDYHNWIASDGPPQCDKSLSSGKRCKIPVSGGIQRELHDWLQADAGFCHLHGGDRSKEAKFQRYGRHL